MAETKIKARRLDLTDAANYLGISRRKMQGMADRDLFTVQQDTPEGNRYVFADELEFWLETFGEPEAREEALRQFRRDRGRAS